MDDITENIQTRLPKKGKAGKILLRAGLCFITSLLIVIIAVMSAISFVHYGPSKSARNLFTATVTKTSAMKFMATWFLSKDTIAEIIGEEHIPASIQATIPDIIDVYDPDDPESTIPEVDKNTIEIIELKGRTYTGKMMIVHDPSRISMGVPPLGYGADKEGMTTLNMVRNSNSIAGINAGGFWDDNWHGNGGEPMGLNETGVVISKGKLLWGTLSKKYDIIGFNDKGILILGTIDRKSVV